MKAHRCPKCDARMEVGYSLADRRNMLQPLIWIEGEPEFWILRILRLRGRRRYRVENWRCTSCGLLESWATERAS